MTKTPAEYQREYRLRQQAKAEPMILPVVREAIMQGDEKPYWIVKAYGCYPAPGQRPSIARSQAERSRAWRDRHKFKVAASKVERLNTEQFQEDRPTPKPPQGKTPAEYQREYRKRARFKAAIEQIERINIEQFQEDSYGKARS